MSDSAIAARPVQRRSDWDYRLLRIGGTLVAASVAVYVLVPIIIALIMSFSGGSILRFPITSWSLKWYDDFFSSTQYTDALVNSIVIAIGATALSTIAGTAAAWAVTQHLVIGRSIVSLLLLLPLFMPGVVLGLGLAITFGNATIFGMNIYGTRLLVIVGHSLWGMPLVFMLMETAFRSLDTQILEASRDLGATAPVTFVEIVLPETATAILSSALFSFVISINEFYMALFLTTRDTQTLPVLMWLALRSAGTPRLAVAAVVLLTVVLVTLFVLLLAYRRRLSRG